MSNQLLASKVVVTEEAPRIRTGVSGPTAVLASLGETERGPFEPTLVTSFEEFANTYGDAFAGSKFPLTVEGFFENGGNFLYVKRIDSAGSAAASGTLLTANTGPTSGTVLASLTGPYSLAPNDDLQVDIDGAGAATATFTATAGSAVSAAETYGIVADEDVTVTIDGGTPQTVTVLVTEVTSGVATADEVAASLNVKLSGCSVSGVGGVVTITSDVLGSSSSVAATGVLAATLGAFTPTAGTGNVADISMVTASEIETIVELAVAGCDVTVEAGAPRITSSTSGITSSVQVLSASLADTKIGLDNVVHSGGTGAPVTTVNLAGKTSGTYANSLTVEITDATSGDADSFNLLVKSGSVVLETFPNLNMYSTSLNYIETVVNDVGNGSLYISATDAAAPLTPPANRPAVIAAATLAGGVNPNPTDSDYTDALPELDTIEGITLLTAPTQVTATVQQALLQYAGVTRQGSMFCVLDPQESDTTAVLVIAYVESTATLLNSSEFGAFYWPEIKVQNDYKDLYGSGTTVTIPPSGHICGMIARTDSARDGGIYQPPAGIERGVLFGVQGFGTEEVKDEVKRDLVYPKRINPITSYNGQRPFVDGTRTLKEDGNFPSVSERRGVSYIEGQIKKRIQFARHSNNNPALRSSVTRTSEAFLLGELGKGAFRSNIPSQAFFVDFGDGLNPESVQFAGKLVGRIGLATNKPADFIILKFSQDTRALEDELANAGL